jgi:hypothetical protein
MLVIGLKFLFTIMHMFWAMYILGLRSSWGTSRVRPSCPLLSFYWLRLCPHFGEPALEATLVRRRLFMVLMTAAHISPNVFSLQMFLSNVQWISHYNTRQKHAHILYITFIHTFTSLCYRSHSHLHFFWSSWQAGCPRLLVSNTITTKGIKRQKNITTNALIDKT